MTFTLSANLGSENLWDGWKDKSVDDDGDGVERSELDAWQRFAHDIVVGSAEKRDALEASVGDLRGYKPLRLLVAGSAGTGKSKTLRSFVRGRRAVRKKFVKGEKIKIIVLKIVLNQLLLKDWAQEFGSQ